MDGVVERLRRPGRARKVARHDLARLNYPPANWVPEQAGPDGQRVLDVLVVGAGMCGQTVGLGPAARRHPQHPRDRAQHARPRRAVEHHGAHADPALAQAPHRPRPRRALPHLPRLVRGAARRRGLGEALQDPAPRLARLPPVGAQGRRPEGRERRRRCSRSSRRATSCRPALSTGETVHGAQGRAGQRPRRLGRLPLAVASLVRSRRSRSARAASSIRWKRSTSPSSTGKRIGVLGVLATAIDNACTALEAGAREAICYARRPHLPQVNKSKGVSFPGFQRGQGMLDDDWRWKIYTYMLAAGSPPPHESVLRAQKLPGFSFRFAEPWLDMIVDDGRRHGEDDQGHRALRRGADRHRLRRRSSRAARNSRPSRPT